MQRIGVFVCHCGTNIAATVDVEAVAKACLEQPNVVFATDYMFMCSEAGQALLRDTIQEQKLDGVVIASCSPRMHENTFRKAAEKAGLNPYMVEIANIREHCSWIHKDKKEATEKAIILATAAIAKVQLNKPLQAGTMPVEKRCLVIGGGIAGIQTALDVAEAGFKVDIVEKNSSIGGRMVQLDKTFPTLDCSSCISTPKMVEAKQHPNIDILAYSEIEDVKGFVGQFDVTIRRKARYVKEDICTGCSACTGVCPMAKIKDVSKPNAIKDEFNMNLSTKGAIYIPFAQAVPCVPAIEKDKCLHFKTGKCGKCAEVCQVQAIDFEQKDSFIERRYGAIVVATGYRPMEPKNYNEFGYYDNKDVITSLELERLMNAAGPSGGTLVRPSYLLDQHNEKAHPKSVVFVQCVGSRESGENMCGKPYCSKICCMYTAKHAMMIREKYPDTEVHVFYIDVRTPGKNYDEFYRRAVEQYGVDYIKGMVGKVTAEGDHLVVQGSDLIANEQIKINADLVVLAVAIEPEPSVRDIATKLAISIDPYNFLNEAHAKLRPVECATAGVFLSGVCQGPKDIPETVAQASAAAAKVIGLLAKDQLVGNPCVSSPNHDLCNGCSTCANVCPYGAITYEDREFNRGREIRRVAVVNEAICQGCGACTVACPSGAMDLKGFTNKQIMSEVDAICR